jgi:hypothetical protein
MVLITGNLVYFQGRVGEYRPKFFPIYASQIASPSTGARHSLTVVDITPTTTTVRQIDADGRELDRFTVAR